jgi:type I restriction enzyme M protein
MNDIKTFEHKTKKLIDDLKSVCANYGLGNDGNEFKIITQVFLYKFLNDKFIYEIKKINKQLDTSKEIENDLKKFNKEKYEMLILQLNANIATLKPEQFISTIFERQNEDNFAKIFDNNLVEIANSNSDIFSVLTAGGEKIVLFENISKYVTDKPDAFCRALINKLVNFSFENIFQEKFDFFATIFEYLIKDYNSNSGGKYAEYFTPHSVSKIMAKCLIQSNVSNVTCYDPSAGSGTLLMNLAHVIGEDKCTIASQDISQKSTLLLRLNLVLNNLVHSIPNIVQGNTILSPYHKGKNDNLKNFDYIVSNPPFKTDFSDYREDLDSKENKERFFAGIPNIPKNKPEKMAIYLLFIQHIFYSLSKNGKAAIVIPTGFITAQGGIAQKIKQFIISNKMLRGVICMPANIFATTGTNVSILFIDKNNQDKKILLMDASKLGTAIKEGKNKKIVLSNEEEKYIIETFNENKIIEDFSCLVTNKQIEDKKFTFNAGQFFKIKIKYTDITKEQFEINKKSFTEKLTSLMSDSKKLEKDIKEQLTKVYKVK